jgi:HKD family nuclease
VTKSDAKLDLHEALSRGSFDHALFSTFTFDPSFFEQHCLEKFKSLHTNGNITVLVDRRIYESLLLDDRSEKPKKANIRYLLQPVSAAGAFHSKIHLLVRRNKGRLVIGSANLTRNGITSNAEMVTSFEYEEDKDQTFKPLFVAAFKYFLEIAQRFPTEALNSNLGHLAGEAPWIVGEDTSSNSALSFLHNLDEPIWRQICREVSEPVDTVYVLSRYFDAKPSFLDEIDKTLSPKKIKIFSQNGITNMTPEWLSHSMVKAKRAQIFLCRFSDADHAQPLHAKALVLERRGRCLLVFGSANFTSAGLLRTISNGNAETVLMIRDISSKLLKPARLFDPDGTAVLLKEAQMLHRTPDEDLCETTTYTMRMNEASLRNDVISITAYVPENVDRETLFATLRFQHFANRSLRVNADAAGSYSVKVSQVEKQRLDNESTMVQLEVVEDGETIASSNWLLITNLKDVKTDRSLRRERRLTEAAQSAVQFFAVLRELLESDDEEALRTFLNFCDIPLIGVARPFLIRRMKPVWDGGAGMKALGAKNLKIYKDLHLAALNFFDRHFRKLHRHTEARTLEGVANFLHIFLAMGGILRAQIERSVIGLESNGSATAEEWADCRKHWDTYFDRFKQLMACLGMEYLLPMIRKYGVNKVKDEFGPDLEPLHELCSDMLNYRDRIEVFRTTKLKRVISPRREIVPGYFYSILSPEQWPRYSREVRGVLANVEQTLGYAA